ncbi:MAG TPA: ABC transporter permease [Rubrobacter sp.]|nr:ABC transporter permease [Rubrobacter sp.]
MRRLLGNIAGALLFPLVAIFLSFAIGALIILATGYNPVAAYAALFEGAFGSPASLGRILLYELRLTDTAPSPQDTASLAAIGRTLVNTTPLVFTGLAVAVAFRAGLFNIGGEGQFFMGAMAAAWLGVALGFLGFGAIPIVLVACALAGFLWGAVPGVLKAYFGAHEVITTIMLNFIAIYFTSYLTRVPLDREGVLPGTEPIAESAKIPTLGAGLGLANYGILLALLAAVAAYLLLWRTKMGFELRAVGFSPGAANYAGIGIGRNTVLALAIGGAFAGLGGGIEVMGVYGNMDLPFVRNVGFNGIGVALLGRNHPVGVVLGALVFGALASGAQQMQFDTQVPLDLTTVLLAVILLFVTATRLVELVLGKRARVLAAGTRLEKGLGS